MSTESSPVTESPDLRLRSFLNRWLRSIIDLDGPTWSAFREVVSCPGRLAVEQLKPVEVGSRAPVHPVRIYLAVNVVFFLLAPWVGNNHIKVWHVHSSAAVEMQPAFEGWLERMVQRSGLDDDTFRLFLDQRMSAQQGAWVWLMIPGLALASFAVSRRRRRFLVEHLIFATNLMSYLLVAILGVGLLGRLVLMAFGLTTPALAGFTVLVLLWLIWVAATGVRSVRQFFDLGWWRSLFLALWLSLGFSAGFWVYMQVLFSSALLGLRGLAVPAG